MIFSINFNKNKEGILLETKKNYAMNIITLYNTNYIKYIYHVNLACSKHIYDSNNQWNHHWCFRPFAQSYYEIRKNNIYNWKQSIYYKEARILYNTLYSYYIYNKYYSFLCSKKYYKLWTVYSRKIFNCGALYKTNIYIIPSN